MNAGSRGDYYRSAEGCQVHPAPRWALALLFKSQATEKVKRKDGGERIHKRKLLIDSKTRWNRCTLAFPPLVLILELSSTFDMLECLVVEKRHVQYVQVYSKKCPPLSIAQWGEIAELLEALQPVRDLTVVLCGQRYVTLSLVQPMVRQMLSSLRDVLGGAGPDVKPLVRKLAAAVRARIPRNNHDQLKASVLDPRTKTLYFATEEERKGTHALLKVELHELDCDVKEKEAEVKERQEKERADKDGEEKAEGGKEEKGEKKDDDDDLLMAAEDEQPRPQQRKKKDVRQLLGLPAFGAAPAPDDPVLEDELDRYLRMPAIPFEQDPLLWWKITAHQFPLLSVLARQYLGTPATATPCERLWSIAGVIVSARRTSLNNASVESIVQLHENLRALAALGVSWAEICDLDAAPAPAKQA